MFNKGKISQDSSKDDSSRDNLEFHNYEEKMLVEIELLLDTSDFYWSGMKKEKPKIEWMLE